MTEQTLSDKIIKVHHNDSIFEKSNFIKMFKEKDLKEAIKKFKEDIEDFNKETKNLNYLNVNHYLLKRFGKELTE